MRSVKVLRYDKGVSVLSEDRCHFAVKKLHGRHMCLHLGCSSAIDSASFFALAFVASSQVLLS